VFNIAELSKSEAEDLIARSLKGERVCVRLQRRHDGTIITKNCPVGARRVFRKRAGITAACATALACFLGIFALRTRTFGATTGKIAPVTEPAEIQQSMGGVAVAHEIADQGQLKTQSHHEPVILGKMVAPPQKTK
jgi:hypothetical protein